MRKTIIFLFVITTAFFACRDKYQIAPLSQQFEKIYTTGLFTPLAKFDSVGYGLALKPDSNICLVRVSNQGSFKIIRNLTYLFENNWKLDSLTNLKFYSTGDLLVIYEQNQDSVKNWRIITLDTLGIVHTVFAKQEFNIDSLNVHHFLVANVNDNGINVVFRANGSINYYFVVNQYDFAGNFVQTQVVPWKFKNLVKAAFNSNGNIAFLSINYIVDSTYFGYLDLNSFSVDYFTVKGEFIYVNNFTFDSDKAFVFVKDLENNHYVYVIDFKNMLLYWHYPAKSFPIIPTTGFIVQDRSIVFGVVRKRAVGINLQNIPNLTVLYGFYGLNNQTLDTTWVKIYSQNLVPIDYLKINDTLYSLFAFGRTFNYFPATFVKKFNTFGKIY